MSKNRTSTRRGTQTRRDFFEEGREQSQSTDALTAAASNCWLCGMPIDYTVPPNSTPDSHNTDHYYPVRDYPELQDDPANYRHSHAQCNVTRGAEAPLPGIGTLSRAW